MERFIFLRNCKTIRYNNYRMFFTLSNKILRVLLLLLLLFFFFTLM